MVLSAAFLEKKFDKLRYLYNLTFTNKLLAKGQKKTCKP